MIVRRIALGAAAALVMAGPAVAHVDVLPREVPAEEPVEFTVRVPNERDVATTSVEIDFPEAVTVFSFADPPRGWTLEPKLANDGRIVGAEYRGELAVERFVDFSFLGTPFEVGTTMWPARQTYADGNVKPWTGQPEDGDGASIETGPTEPGPAAAVEVLASGDVAAAGTEVAAGGSGDDDSDAGIWLGLIAIAIAVLAALGVGLLWSSRPARLPDDPE